MTATSSLREYTGSDNLYLEYKKKKCLIFLLWTLEVL